MGMSLLASIGTYWDLGGVPGVFASAAQYLFGRPSEIKIQPPGLRHPMTLRVRTTDVYVYISVIKEGEYFIDLPANPQIIVDAGANIGAASIYFSHRYPEARIIAIEAEASNFEVLQKNVRPYPLITPIHAALWNKDGEIEVGTPAAATGAVGNSAFMTREGSGVRAITMPTLMKELQLPKIDLLKVDIEGAEKEVFETCDWMGHVQCLMVELHDRFRHGCREAVTAVTHEFSSQERGETTIFVRKS